MAVHNDSMANVLYQFDCFILGMWWSCEIRPIPPRLSSSRFIDPFHSTHSFDFSISHDIQRPNVWDGQSRWFLADSHRHNNQMEMDFEKTYGGNSRYACECECVPKVIYVSQKTVNWCAVKSSSCTSTSEPLLLLVVSAKSEPAIIFARWPKMTSSDDCNEPIIFACVLFSIQFHLSSRFQVRVRV